jgi:hypothetical protein
MTHITIEKEKLEQLLEAWQTSVYGSDSHHKAMLLAMTKVAAQALAAPVQEPEIVQRVKRYAGQTMRTARNPNITARECIELANWLAANTPPAAQPAIPDAIHHTDMSKTLEYIQGWNACRQATLEMMK